MNILIVEDDQTIASGLEYSLQSEGYSTIVCNNTESAIQVISDQEIGLCLLDITLPDGSGYDVCKKAKVLGDLPVIFLTACDEEVNVVMGLDMGADDYITKPFRIRELVSRIHSVLRRYHKEEKTVIQLYDISVHPAEAKVYKKDKELLLTALEYRLLLTFCSNRGKILSRTQLLESIWDVAGDFVNDNTLTVYIKRLREKLEDDPQNPKVIETVRGLGYRAGGNNA